MHSLLPNIFQKYRSIRTKTRSRLFLLSNLPIHTVIYTMVFVCGYASFVYFYDCDPRFSGRVQHKNQITAYWFIKELNEHLPAFPGICMSAIISWGLYSHSNGLLIISDLIINDILKQIPLTNRFVQCFFNKTPVVRLAFKNGIILEVIQCESKASKLVTK